MSSIRVEPQLPRMNTPTLQSGHCPHGAPLGMCSFCMSGGGGGGASKKASAGLMTWNEAYAVWMSIQNAKSRTEDDQKSRQTNMLRMLRETLQGMIRAEWAALISRAMQNTVLAGIFSGMRTAGALLLKPVTATVSALQSSVAFLGRMVQQVLQPFIDISDKLAAILGEQKKLLQEFLADSLDRLKKRLLKVKILESLVTILASQYKRVEEFIAEQLREVRKKLNAFAALLKRPWKNRKLRPGISYSLLETQ